MTQIKWFNNNNSKFMLWNLEFKNYLMKMKTYKKEVPIWNQILDKIMNR